MNFDLNIDNYTRDELIQMFELPVNYDTNIVDIKETRLKESIIQDKDITKETRDKTIIFLMKAKSIILNGITNNEKGSVSNYELQPVPLENIDDHMVQVRRDDKYISSYPNKYIQGVINPIKKRTVQKNLNIDSKFRDNYFSTSASNYNFTLPVNMNDVLQMQLSAIELPTTYYVVSKQYGNNFFNITVNTSTTVINIPNGNYDQIIIMDIINNQLELAGAPFDKVFFAINLTNGTSGSGQTLVGFTDLSGNTLLELDFQADRNGLPDHNTPLPLKFGWTLGFRNGIYTNNLNYVSESVLDITGPKYLFLVVDDYNNSVNNNFYSAFNSSILNKNILARISLQSNTFNILEQNSLILVSTPREYFGPVNIQTMNIQLLDEYGRVVDLNNMDFSFCVTLTTVYDI